MAPKGALQDFTDDELACDERVAANDGLNEASLDEEEACPSEGRGRKRRRRRRSDREKFQQTVQSDSGDQEMEADVFDEPETPPEPVRKVRAKLLARTAVNTLLHDTKSHLDDDAASGSGREEETTRIIPRTILQLRNGAHQPEKRRRRRSKRPKEVESEMMEEDDDVEDVHEQSLPIDESPLRRPQKPPDLQLSSRRPRKAERRPSTMLQPSGVIVSDAKLSSTSTSHEDRIRETREAAMRAFGLLHKKQKTDEDAQDLEAEKRRKALEAFRLVVRPDA